jgi:hypothetical protein
MSFRASNAVTEVTSKGTMIAPADAKVAFFSLSLDSYQTRSVRHWPMQCEMQHTGRVRTETMISVCFALIANNSLMMCFPWFPDPHTAKDLKGDIVGDGVVGSRGCVWGSGSKLCCQNVQSLVPFLYTLNGMRTQSSGRICISMIS